MWSSYPDMGTKLKTKLSVGLIFLFVVILLFGVLGLFYINRLSSDAGLVLKDNHESLLYCNNMLTALENLPAHPGSMAVFKENLQKQEANVTEPGEGDITETLRKDFDSLQARPGDPDLYSHMRLSIVNIQQLNESAILRKNEVASHTARNARSVLTGIFTILTLVSFTFIFNLPGIISDPIRSLSEGIREIANKNYSKRIYLKQNDEFGDLANAFNVMAGKLDEYENSNLARIKFEKSRTEAIINQMRDGILCLDDKKNVLFLNAVAEKLLGLKEVDIIGHYAPDIALTNDLMRTLLLQEEEKKELKIYADNKESYFNKDIIQVRYLDQFIGQVIVLRNITPFHELNEAKTNFLATVSHELKTPISSIKMSARLLNDKRVGQLNHEQEELVKSVYDDADRLLRITAELLNMAQVETGNIQLKRQPVAAGNIIDSSVQAVQVQARQKQIRIDVQVPDPAPFVYADVEKTSWVLINFLTNAIRFSPEHATIRIGVTEKDGQWIFSVEDRGPGIDEKFLPRIFDRYFKVPGTFSASGTGLGLAISKEFIEAQGGHTGVDSHVGEGSRFYFSLPPVR